MVGGVTDQTTQAPTENVARGALLALLAIPAAVIAFAIVGAIFGGVSGIAAIVVPYIAAFLYRLGAGAPLSRAGWAPFIGISAVAILVGTFAGIASTAWTAFNSVGGDNALVNPAFWRTVGNQFTSGLGDNLVPILIGLVLGAVGIVSIVRGRGFGGSRFGIQPSGRIAPADVSIYTQPEAPTIPAPPAAPNGTTPGTMLNGKPVEPEK